MVSLDDAVVARLEKGGKRYEILVDPELVDDWKADNESVPLDKLLVILLTRTYKTHTSVVSVVKW